MSRFIASIQFQCLVCKQPQSLTLYQHDGCTCYGISPQDKSRHAVVFVVEEDKSELKFSILCHSCYEHDRELTEPNPDIRLSLQHCPECRTVGDLEDNRHKAWCPRLELQRDCSHKFIDSKHCLKCGWVPPKDSME